MYKPSILPPPTPNILVDPPSTLQELVKAQELTVNRLYNVQSELNTLRQRLVGEPSPQNNALSSNDVPKEPLYSSDSLLGRLENDTYHQRVALNRIEELIQQITSYLGS